MKTTPKNVEEKGSDKPEVLTFAERLKLKKQQKEREEKREGKGKKEVPVQEETKSAIESAPVPPSEQVKEETEVA
nr:ALI_HP1_G0023480.mRNA.1.CDS.1 [Saccharomyces cerevisiae]